MTKKPVLLVGYNRPEPLRRVADAIGRASPSAVYVVLDGPKPHLESDRRLRLACEEVIRSVEWPCPLITEFRNENLGVSVGMQKAISWFFEQERSGIILEDDCLPDQSFFTFANHCLEKFESRNDIWLISGTNLLGRWQESIQDFTLSEGHIWGWATWRDRWAKTSLDALADKDAWAIAEQYYGSNWAYRKRLMQGVVAGTISAWDIQWLFTVAINAGLAVIPSVNLVENIGHGADATHTTGYSRFANIPKVPLHGPPYREPASWAFDRRFQEELARQLSSDGRRARVSYMWKRLVGRR